MNLIEGAQKGMRQLAEKHSDGKGIDKHWQAVLPETDNIIENEIFLALYTDVVDQSMRHRATQIAKQLPLRDVRPINDAELYLRVLVRQTWLGIADNREFQVQVHRHMAPNTTPNQQCIGYAKFGELWLPVSTQNFAVVIGALAERVRQWVFAEHCYDELRRRHAGRKVSKYMWALLQPDSEVITEENRAEAHKYLTAYSSNVTRDLTYINPLDALHDWWAKLSVLHTHIQMLKMRATGRGIRHVAIDMLREEQRHQRVSLEEADGVAANADESLENPDEIADNVRQNLVAHQKEIEAILSCNRIMAVRQFQVLLMLTRDPQPTNAEIAKRLQTSPQTIGRDRDVIEANRRKIRNIIES